MHATPFVPPAGGGPWPEGAEDLLVEILLGPRRMLHLIFRQDVLMTMGTSAKARDIHLDVREDCTPPSHVREILRAIRTSRDPRAALEALAEALEGLAPNDGAWDWLKLTRRVLNCGDELPRSELLAVINELHTITAPARPARHLPQDIQGLWERETAEMTLPTVLDLLVNRIAEDPLGPLVAFLRALGDNPEVTRQRPLPALRRFLAAHADRAPATAAPPGNGELVDALMAFELLRRADGRYDLLYTMGAHLGLAHSFEAEERPDRRTHLHQIVRACRSFRDSRSALWALRTAMAELAPDDGALDTLDAVVGRALGEREDG
ncbi:effector-associated domain 2-containing protein [Kitasatospora purpeofusca]|uniref:effector-associated domain 2-containing protein n=1 Tax=Kitasatospora purpeofusca TaxID=67352 RepID=UPI0036688420